MAIYKPPKLKNAKEFLTDKKVNRSSPEEYYEVTSQKFSLYDPDTAYSGSQRAKQENESEKRLSLPKVNLQELRDNSINQFTEYLPQEEVSRLNRIAHQGEQPKQSLMEKLTSNVTGENRATLGVQKKPSAPRINSQVATLAGKQPEQYSQQQSAEGDRFQSDGNIEGQVANTEKQKTDIGAVGRSLRDLPRNLASGALNALEQGSELLTFGMQSNDIKPRTRESWEKMNQTNTNPNKPKTYEEYLASIDKMNQDTKDFQAKVASVGSEVTSDTTLFEKMVKGAAQSLPSSLMTAAMGGGLAGVAGAFVSNPIVVETIRTTPLFASGTHSGLKTAEELGLTGAKKYSYAVLSGLLEAGTERLSSLGLEGKLLGKKTSGGVGGTKEFLRAIFEESGSEMLNEVGQQLLTGQYTNYEDFELDFENIIVAGGSAALMGGFGAVGELSNGLKYKTVGTEDNMVIIETEDGRREKVNPEIVMRHQLANGRTARMAQEMLKADTEIQELAKTFGEQEETSTAMPVELTTTTQEALEVKTEPSTLIDEKPLTEPLNEQAVEEMEKVKEEYGADDPSSYATESDAVDVEYDNQGRPMKTNEEQQASVRNAEKWLKTIEAMHGKDSEIAKRVRAQMVQELKDEGIIFKDDIRKSAAIPPPETELKANEEKLNNMIEKGLIDTKRKRDVAKSLNQKIVEQGGQDRLEEIEPKKVETPKVNNTKDIETKESIPWKASEEARSFSESLPYEDASFYLGDLTNKNVVGDTEKTKAETIYEEVLKGNQFKREKNGKNYKYSIVDANGEYLNYSDEVSYGFANYLTKKLGIKTNESKPKAPMVKTVKVGEYKGTLDSTEIIRRDSNGDIEYPERQGHKFEIIKGAPILVYNNATDSVKNDWVVVDYQTGYSFGQSGEFKSRKAAVEGYVNGYAKTHEKILNDGVITKQAEINNEKKIELSKKNRDGTIYAYEKIKKHGGEAIPEGEYLRKYGMGVDFDRKLTRAEMEKYGLKLVSTEKSDASYEDTDLISSDDDLMVNNMAMEAEIEPMESAELVTTDLPEIEMMDGYKTSATKKSLLKTENIPQAYKDNAVEPDPMLYETSQRIAREIEANQEIETKTYDVVTKEVLANHKADPKLYQSKEGQAMVQSLIKKNIDLRKQYKDNGFYQEQYEELQKVWRETGTDLGQSLNMRKQLYGDTVEGKIIEAEKVIEDSKTKEHRELEERLNKIVDDIFKETVELDENGVVKPDSEFEEVIAEIKKQFGLSNAWIKMLRQNLADGTLTKTKMKEIIKEKMGIPMLTIAEVDKITRIMEKLNELDPKSETYEKDKEAILQDATMVYAQKDVTFWTKLSTYQTMAMLMNVKTALRNEIGNLMGFTTAQVDDVFSFFFDEGIAKITKQRATVNPRNPLKLKYRKGVVKSFEAYGSFLVDASDNKYVKRRVFAPGSTMGKLEGVMSVMLSDARWKQPRVEFLLEQIAATERYAKERGLEYDAETARLKENINFIADYDTFNFNSKPAQVLDGVVKSMNKIGNKDFGLGTLFAKFAKTPMNIIKYQIDHIGWDLFAQGVKLARQSKQMGFENALKQNQGRISRALGKTATGMTYVTLGAMLSNLGAFVEEEEDKNVKNILEAQGIKGGYFNFSALRRSITSGTPSSYKDGDTVLSVNWMLPVAPFLLLGSRFANAKDSKEAQGITDTVQSLLEAGGSSLQDFAELPFNRTLGILTNSYDSGMDKFNKLVGGTVTGFVPSVVKQVAQGIDPTSKQYSKNSGEAVVQQIKATIPGLRNTVPNRFNVTGETQTVTDNSTTAGNIFEMLLNPAFRDTIEADKDLQKVVELNKKVGLPSLPKITNGYFSYKSNRYDMTQEEHQEFQTTYWNAYKRTYNKKNDGNFVNAHDYAMNQAKINYLKKKKVKFETTSSGNLK